MRTRRADPRPPGALALLAVAVTGALVVAGGSGGGAAVSPPEVSPAGWAGLVGGMRPRVSVGQRVLVVLRAASLADRVAAAGGVASALAERAWWREARAKPKRLI